MTTERDNVRAFGWDRVAHMNAAKARKVQTGGRVYAKAPKRSDFAPIDKASHGHFLTVLRSAWDFARSDAIEQFRFDVYGDQWAGL